jgi:hypothetical protein
VAAVLISLRALERSRVVDMDVPDYEHTAVQPSGTASADTVPNYAVA